MHVQIASRRIGRVISDEEDGTTTFRLPEYASPILRSRQDVLDQLPPVDVTLPEGWDHIYFTWTLLASILGGNKQRSIVR